jgi:DNA-binding NarL/FixJ family response regulator
MSTPLRVLLLEDSEADADLIVAELDHAMKAQVQRVNSREAFVDALREFAPDVVLTDHSLASFNSLAALDAVRAHSPATPVIVVTGALDARAVIACARAGAEEVVLKSNLRRLPAAIAAARAVRRRLQKLTPRHLQVLRLIAEGQTTPAVARRLGLSVKTVESHRTELMKRLGIHDIAALVRYAVRLGVIPVET